MSVENAELLRHEGWWGISWGTGGGRWASKVCGVATWCRSAVLAQRCVRRVFSPPACLQGRAGAVRWRRGPIDVCVANVYAPTEPRANKKGEGWAALLRWLDQLLAGLPARCTLIVAGDWNAHVGQQDRRADRSYEQIVGPFGTQDVNKNGTRLLEWLQRWRLCLPQTMSLRGAGPTWYGYAETASRIDCIAVPLSKR